MYTCEDVALCLFIRGFMHCQFDLCVSLGFSVCVCALGCWMCVCGVRMHAYEAFVSNWNVPSGKLARGARVIL